MGAYWTITLFTIDRHRQNDDKKSTIYEIDVCFCSCLSFWLCIYAVCKTGWGKGRKKISVCLSMYLTSEGNILAYCIVSAIMNSQNDIHESIVIEYETDL